MNASLDFKVILSIPRDMLAFEAALITRASNFKFFEINIPKSELRSVFTRVIRSLLL